MDQAKADEDKGQDRAEDADQIRARPNRVAEHAGEDLEAGKRAHHHGDLSDPLLASEELPPSPLVWILDWGQSIRPVQVVGNPVHPLTFADTNVHFHFSAFLSIGHVLSKLF